MAETKLKPQGMDLTADYTFSGAMAFDSATLVVDDANNRVGVGTASPAYSLDIAGDFHVSSSGIFDAQLLMDDGTAQAPGLAFTSDPDTGITNGGTPDVIRFITGGVERFSFGNNNAGFSIALGIPDGTAALPGLAFNADLDTGIYRGGTNILNLGTNETERISMKADGKIGLGGTGSTLATQYVFNTPGSTDASFLSVDQTLGLVVANPDTTNSNYSFIGFSQNTQGDVIDAMIVGIHENHTGGFEKGRISIVTKQGASLVECARFHDTRAFFPYGAESAPGITFLNDVNTGLFHPAGDDELALVTGGVSAMEIQGNGQLRCVDGSASAPTFSFKDDSDSGMYRSGDDVLRFATNGTEAVTVNATQDFSINNFGIFKDWTSYTPTITGFGTVTVNNAFYRVVGSTMEIKGTFTSGTITAANGTITLPSGFIVDVNKIPEDNSKTFLGFIFRLSNGGNTLVTTTNTAMVFYVQNGQTASVSITNRGESKEFNPQLVTEYWTSDDGASYWISVPVAGT